MSIPDLREVEPHGDQNAGGDKELRFKCLKLAQDATRGDPSVEGIILRARSYADYVMGTNDAEIIGAVRDLVKKVAA